jgi:serine/threonine protein kinase
MSSATPDQPSSTPSASPPVRFRETALASGLLAAGQLDAVEAELRLVMNPQTAEPVAWDQAVADLLVGQGLLTKFQAREMLAGRRRFRLGQYTVLDEIGRGGMGQVFKAEHAMMGREVAVKVLPRAKSTPEYEAAFQREIRMLARLDHENLVRALDAGHDAKVYYLVTELVPGFDLRKQILKYGPLDEIAAASVIVQAARGLAYAHEQGLVHRDVKPGNLLVTQDGRVKVLDLGLAGSTLDSESTSTGRVIGTMDYMAPEQIRTPDAVGPAADIYALGCTLYFTLSGQLPFPGGTRKEKAQRQLAETPVPLGQLAPHIDPELCRVVEGMMRKSPAERIATAHEVIQRLLPWTPRALMPMPRTPVDPAGDRRRGPLQRDLPPPLPPVSGQSSRSESSVSEHLASLSARSSLLPMEDARSADGPGLEQFQWPAPPGLPPVRTASPADFFETLLSGADGRRMLRRLGRAVVVAAVAGIAFGWVMGIIRGIDPQRFRGLLGGLSPGALGWAAFLLLLAVQAGAVFGRGPRR